MAEYLRAAWDHHAGRQALHRGRVPVSNFGAVVTHAAKRDSHEGFEAEWRAITLSIVDGDSDQAATRSSTRQTSIRASRGSMNSAPPVPAARERGDPALLAYRGCFQPPRSRGFSGRNHDERHNMTIGERPSLRGPVTQNRPRDAVRGGRGWQLTIEPSPRGDHLALSRHTYRDADEADRPIAIEALVLTEVTDDQSGLLLALFDPDDINDAIAELTARWIASGEVAHPEVIEAGRQHIEAANRHDWDAIAEIPRATT